MFLNKNFIHNAFSDVACYVVENQKIKKVTTWPDQGEVTVSIDSRTIQPGQLFWALKGEVFDGHNFIGQALERGACAVVVNNLDVVKLFKNKAENFLAFVVSDTSKALVDAAKARRNELAIPFIGITGSVGKTSTKQILASIFVSAGKQAFVSYKNQNNTIGLPLNLLNVKESDQLAVFELGISYKGEMSQLVDILRPDYALITCVAHAHGQGLGTLTEIAVEKREIFKYFSGKNIGVVFGDQALLSGVSYPHPVAYFGFKMKNQVQARKVNMVRDEQGNIVSSFILKWYGRKVAVKLAGNHKGMISNVLAASTLAYFLDISLETVVQGIQAYKGTEGRFEVLPLKGRKGRIINDCYNANPESMKAALAAFDRMSASGKKIVVLGDMLELGERERYWHRQVGRFLARLSSIDSVILVGARAADIASTLSGRFKVNKAKDYKQASKMLDKRLSSDDSLVLVKASNGMNLNAIIREFTQ